MNTRVSLIVLAAATSLSLVACEKDRSGTSTAGTPGTNTHTPGTNTNTTTDNNMKTPTTPTETGAPPANTTQPGETPSGTSDTKLTSDVNQAIQSDSSLSTDARNCTVSVTNGVVTLDGTVDSQSERDQVVAKARGVTGVSRVVDHLQVKSK